LAGSQGGERRGAASPDRPADDSSQGAVRSTLLPDRARRGARGALYPKTSTSGAESLPEGDRHSGQHRARSVEGRVLRGGTP